MEIELRMLCYNKNGHCINRYFRTESNIKEYIEEEIRDYLEKEEAVYEYLRIQFYNNKCIATAFNG